MLKKYLLAITVIVALILSGCKMTPALSSTQPLTSPTISPNFPISSPAKTGQWEIFTDGNQIRDLLVSGNDLWAATEGGVVRWDIEKGTYVKYTTADGLISDGVRSITRDSLGNLWFGTLGGVSRFDGTHWQNFTTQDGLSDNAIISITSDNQGNIVAGALDASISLYDGKTWRTISSRDIRPSVDNSGIQQLIADDSGNIWAVIWGQLERYNGQSWHTLTETDGWTNPNQGIMDMARAPDGSLWFSTGISLLRYDGRSFQTITTGDNQLSAFKIAFDSHGNPWCINNTSISHYDGNSWQTYTIDELTRSSSGLMAIAVDEKDNVWSGNYDGVFRFDGQTWRTYVTTDGLADNVVRSIFTDRSGNLWVSTDAGMARYDGNNWQTFTPADGLPEGSASSIFQDSQGNIWFGTVWGKIGRYDGKTWQTFAPVANNAPSNIQVINQDHQGNLWFGTLNYVIRNDGQSWQKYDLRIGVQNMNVLVSGIAVDNLGNIWVSTENNGVMRYNGTDWKVYTTKDGLISNLVGPVFQDSQGRLWFANDKGFNLYDGQTWSTFKLAGVNVVMPIAEDHAGNIWFGNYNGGLVRYSGKSWQVFTTADGLISDLVYSITIDAQDNLWVTTNAGIGRYDGRQWHSYTTADGISSNGVTRAVASKDGSLWFITNSGLSHYIP